MRSLGYLSLGTTARLQQLARWWSSQGEQRSRYAWAERCTCCVFNPSPSPSPIPLPSLSPPLPSPPPPLPPPPLPSLSLSAGSIHTRVQPAMPWVRTRPTSQCVREVSPCTDPLSTRFGQQTGHAIHLPCLLQVHTMGMGTFNYIHELCMPWLLVVSVFRNAKR